MVCCPALVCSLSLSLSLGPVFVTSGILLAELLFVTELFFFLFRFTAHPGVTDRSTGTASSGRASRSRGFFHRRATLFVGGGSGTANKKEEREQGEKKQLVKRNQKNVKQTKPPTLETAQLWVRRPIPEPVCWCFSSLSSWPFSTWTFSVFSSFWNSKRMKDHLNHNQQ